ncbi:hypothetical protein [Vibrio europaeus]|uniref:Uncharacterized protein n=1 Tax=Vibrio europaeus TaxID=300876 RepID=A0A178J3K1_9VIBR|nr:hypothetical protein [Vibrio europaeus]MDC5708394.1 hypothetical protein [Vibrio europaeus]MDC5713127.1 hypothetical protein [Vibrio europaeus]MDC5728172.1 hypothetical protein [Vibrio europaeus]MDC5733233.1 hypothetical protein [Vibrio europaeus]MDC5742319.1 hypothetical protein [Vibrio europaeus]
MNTQLTLEQSTLNADEAVNLLLCFVTNVAATIRLNTTFYQGSPMPSETPSNLLWLSDLLAGLNDLSQVLLQKNTNQVEQEVDRLVTYWTHYHDEIESARKNTAGDSLKWNIDDGLNILNLLKSTHCCISK